MFTKSFVCPVLQSSAGRSFQTRRSVAVNDLSQNVQLQRGPRQTDRSAMGGAGTAVAVLLLREVRQNKILNSVEWVVINSKRNSQEY